MLRGFQSLRMAFKVEAGTSPSSSPEVTNVERFQVWRRAFIEEFLRLGEPLQCGPTELA